MTSLHFESPFLKGGAAPFHSEPAALELLATKTLVGSMGQVKNPHAAIASTRHKGNNPGADTAEAIREALGGRAQVGAGRQPHEPDGETVLVAQADLDAVVVDNDRDVLTWDGSRGVSSSSFS
jgi:hypothetical protein